MQYRPKPCRECGREFLPNSANHQVCDQCRFAPCEICGTPVKITGRGHPCSRVFCSRRCLGVARSEDMRGNSYAAGHAPWNKGRRCPQLDGNQHAAGSGPNRTSFKPGHRGTRRLPVGAERTRTRTRDGKKRWWVKVAEPGVWHLRARVAWEAAHGPIPRGMLVHHINGNQEDDAAANLMLVSRAAHLNVHRKDWSGPVDPLVCPSRLTANGVRP